MPILTGSDYDREIRVLKHSDRSPVDLTGFVLEMVFKAQRGDPAALLTLTLGAGLTIADPTSGTILMSLTPDDTAALGAGEPVFALYRLDGGRRLALATGKARVAVGV